jgi:hypothetical protein
MESMTSGRSSLPDVFFFAWEKGLNVCGRDFARGDFVFEIVGAEAIEAALIGSACG